LLERSPWPLPRLEQLPAQLDEPWYEALREALRQLHAQGGQLLGDDLARWLHGQTGDK
jgi:membrane protein